MVVAPIEMDHGRGEGAGTRCGRGRREGGGCGGVVFGRRGRGGRWAGSGVCCGGRRRRDGWQGITGAINPSSKSGVHIKNVAANPTATPHQTDTVRLFFPSRSHHRGASRRCPGRARRGKTALGAVSADPTLYTPVPDILISVDRFSDLYTTRNRSRAYSRVRSPCSISHPSRRKPCVSAAHQTPASSARQAGGCDELSVTYRRACRN